MLRRDFVRAVISASLAPKALLAQEAAGTPAPSLPAPVPWTQGLSPKTPIPATAVADAVAETEQRFFTPLQMSTLERLSNLLLPPIDGKPGALEAQTPLFLDFLIGSSPEARKKMYAEGLDWLNGESQKKYAKGFSALDDAQAGELIKPWLRTWMSDHPPTDPHAGFINIAHDDIRTATVNSKAWSEVPSTGAEAPGAIGLYWLPIEPEIHAPGAACTAPHVLAQPKAGHPLPVYPR